MNKIIVITGPTGVGKTKLSIELAKIFNGEIINADSMQVYKGLNIGTAKIKEDEKENIPHHLFDICDITDPYNIYRYQKESREKIKEIQDRNKTVIIVGGSALYIKSALYDYTFEQESIKDDYQELTNQQILDEINKIYTTTIHVNNRKRLIRELNKIKNNTKPTNNKNKLLYDTIFIGLTTTREKLYQIIDERVDKMISEGLLDEAYTLYQNNNSIPPAIGYKELYDYFNNKVSKDEAISKIKKASRNYAKRQYTFINNQMDVEWFDVNFSNFNETVQKTLNYINNEKYLK